MASSYRHFPDLWKTQRCPQGALTCLRTPRRQETPAGGKAGLAELPAVKAQEQQAPEEPSQTLTLQVYPDMRFG